MIDTSCFQAISLDQMGRVKLMNRTDTKYWFDERSLQHVLNLVTKDYYVLHIYGVTQLPYATTYFDTINNEMYIAHQNGKLNRYKVRKRSYEISGLSFLEVKFKNNKGRTIKERVPTKGTSPDFSSSERDFLQTAIPFSDIELQATLLNSFKRITLVNKNFKERCTIDIQIQFVSKQRSVALDKLVIIEIKTGGSASQSPLALA